MPLSMPEVTQDLDLSILEQLDDFDNIKCDNDACDNDATHSIRCTCEKGTEYSCKPCIDSMMEGFQKNPFLGLIRFDASKSCGHDTFIALCTISPL